MEFLFLTKKVVAFFVEPLGLILTLASIGLYYLYKSNHSKAKVFLSVAIFLLLAFSYPPIANGLIKQLEATYSKYIQTDDQIEYIHVLGGGHYNNSDWPLSAQISNTSLKRTLEGISIFKQINSPNLKLIFTGFPGLDNQTSNAEMNAKIARIANISNDHLIINSKPKDTQEEAAFAESIIGNKPFILVTSASHMPRAIKLFKNLGLNPIAAPTDFKGKNKPLFSAPTIGSFKKSKNAVHEFLGIAWAYLVR
ncbi:Membrane Protein Functionally coupled to the MukBEF Chromosome Partitioning Mechanism [Bathymodiolus heckerae thiotrophic gill symbiont]|uniref:ElyC/SanA/YdcF family protein n=1 Tax=Bathymodiolus heckerae thiotrophic gill symbiont TaxID=1052212 RepID=UPI0010BAC7F0|nr:ElyC/SanA/YdcF family protein [Bathymodiolus heckerae thiotrophic gill symbiont]SHN91056.1 Membrane Protein Functionally coupled to the MukBEF Chromosome Partitioning Mechanism [Bathymodiolus heckerae thiotrophic gill symbiont]